MRTNSAHPGESRDPSRVSAAATLDPSQLLRLLTWLSPAFPIGAFAYSHGLEQAIRDGRVTNAGQLRAWACALLAHGSGWTDAVLLKAAWDAAGDAAALAEVAELAAALPASLERRRETLAQGEAFMQAARPWLSDLPQGNKDIAYPVAVGLTAGRLGVPLEPALTAYLHAFAANLVSAAVRAVPLGQSQAVAVLAALEPAILAAAARAALSSLDDLGSAAILSDIAAMRHETLQPRLFIS